MAIGCRAAATRQRSRILWLAALGVIGSTSCVLLAQTPHTISVTPGQNIQQTVDNAPEGTRFLFAPGIYRQQTIIPKNRQQFIGQDGVIMNGAMALTSWTQVAGFWQADGLPVPWTSTENATTARISASGGKTFSSTTVCTNASEDWPSLAPGNGTTRAAAPIWPMTRPGSWSNLA